MTGRLQALYLLGVSWFYILHDELSADELLTHCHPGLRVYHGLGTLSELTQMLHG